VDAPVVAARGLRREYAGVPVLVAVDLDVAAGDCVVLLGANGAGKTTLLRVLATLLRPSGGALRLFGHDAARRPAAVRAQLGWVGHETGCYPDLTARENLRFHARLHGVDEARVGECLAWSGLDGAADRPLRTYSRGMAQRLALARALLPRPGLLLLDEPFTGLDVDASARLVALLATVRAEGTAIVMSTHDPARVDELSPRTVVLARGRVTEAGA
jgi:heme ABC exporter ATP-binding subunit CcmA